VSGLGDNQAEFEAIEVSLLAGALPAKLLVLINFAALDADVAADRNRTGVSDMDALLIGLLVYLSQHEQARLPKGFGQLMQSSVEATFGKWGQISVAAQKSQGCLLIAVEILGSDQSNRHDLRRGQASLGIVVMIEGFEQFVKEAVNRYNLVGHGRLRKREVDNRTLPNACYVRQKRKVATWVNIMMPLFLERWNLRGEADRTLLMSELVGKYETERRRQ
jgi:hypothetical protein